MGMRDYRRPFSIYKPNEEWQDIALRCYNKSKIGLFI